MLCQVHGRSSVPTSTGQHMRYAEGCAKRSRRGEAQRMEGTVSTWHARQISRQIFLAVTQTGPTCVRHQRRCSITSFANLRTHPLPYLCSYPSCSYPTLALPVTIPTTPGCSNAGYASGCVPSASARARELQTMPRHVTTHGFDHGTHQELLHLLGPIRLQVFAKRCRISWVPR